MHWPHQQCGGLMWLKMWCHQLCLEKNRIPTLSKAPKAKVTGTFLKEQDIQVLAHPLGQSWHGSVWVWLFRLIREKYAGQKFSRIYFRSLQKQQIQSSMHCHLHPVIKMHLNLGADDWNCVCTVEESMLKHVDVVSKLDHNFLSYWPMDITKWTALVCRFGQWRQAVVCHLQVKASMFVVLGEL